MEIEESNEICKNASVKERIADKVEKTDKMKTGGGHRPSVLFRYKRKK